MLTEKKVLACQGQEYVNNLPLIRGMGEDSSRVNGSGQKSWPRWRLLTMTDC